MTQDSQSFGVRLDAPTLARLDAYAERLARKRGWAAARAIVAGLDALEGVAPPLAAAPFPGSNAAAPVDVQALAGALYDRIGPMLADAAAEGAARRAPRLDVAPVGVVGVARVVDALRGAFEAAREGGELPDREARARLSRAVIEAINVLAYGEGDDAPTKPADASPAARPAPLPEPAAAVPETPAPRLPAHAVRGLQRERRRGSPERRDPPPREGPPGRRLPDAMKAAREARSLSQRSAADAAGVPLATFQRAESGKDVRPETRERLEAWIGG